MAFVTLILLVFSIPTTTSISLTDHATTGNRNLLPASRLVDLKFHQVDTEDCSSFEHDHHVPVATDGATFSSLLRRRDGLSIYGKDIVHTPDEPNCATLSMLPITDKTNHDDEFEWEATLLLTPSQQPAKQNDLCFVAMNRFAVKEDCRDLFEQRWAERSSKLPKQAGFLSFCLIRKKETNHGIVPFNYSSLTLWESFDAWTAWRNGDGRYSHDASKASKRTPVSAWLKHSASPIFWDGTATIMAETGI